MSGLWPDSLIIGQEANVKMCREAFVQFIFMPGGGIQDLSALVKEAGFSQMEELRILQSSTFSQRLRKST
jgi:hypothetical protein